MIEPVLLARFIDTHSLNPITVNLEAYLNCFGALEFIIATSSVYKISTCDALACVNCMVGMKSL